jgi:hypothetical protein
MTVFWLVWHPCDCVEPIYGGKARWFTHEEHARKWMKGCDPCWRCDRIEILINKETTNV